MLAFGQLTIVSPSDQGIAGYNTKSGNLAASVACTVLHHKDYDATIYLEGPQGEIARSVDLVATESGVTVTREAYWFRELLQRCAVVPAPDHNHNFHQKHKTLRRHLQQSELRLSTWQGKEANSEEQGS